MPARTSCTGTAVTPERVSHQQHGHRGALAGAAIRRQLQDLFEWFEGIDLFVHPKDHLVPELAQLSIRGVQYLLDAAIGDGHDLTLQAVPAAHGSRSD